MELSLIEGKILTIRGNKVMLNFDLAELYGVETRVPEQAVRWDIDRFPDDFMSNRRRRSLKTGGHNL